MFTMFPMNYDAESSILSVTVRDVIYPPGMVMLHKAINRKIARLGAGRPGLGILCDCRELDTMMKLISEWDVMLGRWDGRISYPFALVVDATISPSALKARLSAPDVAVFHDVDKARAWLTQRRVTVVSA